jgi:hypothetical protein
LISEGQIIDLLTVITGQVLIDRNVFLPFNGELVNGHCDALSPVEEKGSLGIFGEVKYFLKIAAQLSASCYSVRCIIIIIV